eukprot:g1091.t1
MTTSLTLISHALCPYVQRAAIVLAEKDIPFERIMIDLGNKPDWFKAASPLGKVPLLKTGGQYLFESAPIVEFLEETYAPPLHPADPVERAQHRAYVEFASQTLNGIGALYSARDTTGFTAASEALKVKFNHIETVLAPSGPFFAGPSFSLVDAAFAPGLHLASSALGAPVSAPSRFRAVSCAFARILAQEEQLDIAASGPS